MKNKKNEPRISIAAHLPNPTKPSKDNQFDLIMKWAAVIGNHPHLYTPINQMASDYHYYSVEFMQVTDIDVLLGKKKQYLQITCIIYNKHSQSFVGTTYSSEMFDIESQTQEKPASFCNKSIYFYTELNNIVLKVDIWRLESDKNTKGIQNMSKRLYVGGFEIGLGESMESGVIEKTLNQNQMKRFDTIHQNQTIQTENNQESTKKKPPKIVFRIINTHSLSHLHHFIPHNHIFDNHNIILGLKDSKIGLNGDIQMGDRNRLNFEIKSLTIPSNMIKYLAQISESKINSNFEISGRPAINIKEVRLNFQFHNGWKSVCSESLLLKQNNPQSQSFYDGTKSVVPSKMQSKNFKSKQAMIKNRVYGFDKPKQLKAVFTGEGGVVMMCLEAKIESKFEMADKKSKTENFYLPLAFALKAIPQVEQEITTSIELKCGNAYNLSNLIAYFSEMKLKKNKEGKPQDNSQKIICEISFLLKRTGGTIENIETVEKQINQIEALKVQKQRLARLKRKVKEEKRKKMIELNQQIPFLDTVQLKQQLYQQKITRIKNQKLEQEEILFFLKTRLNQLERQTLNNQLNYEQNDENDSEEDSRAIKVKKLPNNFIDYRPEPMLININDSIVINQFNAYYCKMAMTPYQQASPNLLQACLHSQTFLQFKIIQLQVYHKQIEVLALLVPNFQGNLQCLPLSVKQFQNKTLEVKINFSTQKTQLILNSLLNGFFTIMIECQDNKRLRAATLITVCELIEKCKNGDLLESIQKQIRFEQEGTLVSQMKFEVAFTNNSNNASTVVIQSPSKMKTLENQPGTLNILSRINRFKKQNGREDSKKREIVQNIISNIGINKVEVYCRQSKENKVVINASNSTNSKQSYCIHIFDQDSSCLKKEELSILQLNSLSSKEIISINFKNKSFELEPAQSCQIVFNYTSSRMNANLSQIDNLQELDMDIFRSYNHPHKINIHITQNITNIIVSRHQLSIMPEYEYNTYSLQRFLSKAETIVFPIVTNNLSLIAAKNDIIQNPMKLDLTIPPLRNSQLYFSQFSLRKQSQQSNIPFQSFVFYGWGCQLFQLQGRLWDVKDVLIKIPLQVILKRQINLPFQIDHITAISRHISLKIRQAGQFKYSSTFNINRKNSEILLRAELTLESIGKNTYGIEIADKNSKIFHRIGINVNVSFPTLAAHQIIPIKVPSERLDDADPFQFKNRQEVGLQYMLKCYKPYLLRFAEEKCFLKVDQQWKIEMLFNWNRIVGEMLEQDKDQVSILIGIKSRLAIQYLLFKIKNN